MGAVRSRRIVGQGTPESAWRPWLAQQQWPVLAINELLQSARRVVVVAPHPDDEVLGAGGLLHQAQAVGRASLVVAVTDGEASHPGSALWSGEHLVQQRARESEQALAVLAPQAQRLRLGLPDGQVGQQVLPLSATLRQMLRPDDVVLCTWRQDGHPDHEATGHACVDAALSVGCRCYELPIWTWHWADPGDTRVPWSRAVSIALPAALLALKQQALACFASQLQPDPSTGKPAILPAWATARLLRPFEVLFR